MYHVKAMDESPPGGLDLNIADEDEFSPDKLRANIERLYMTVIIGLIGFGKHIARLRSWREPRRTGAFCTVILSIAASVSCANGGAGILYGLDVQFSSTDGISYCHCTHCIPPVTSNPVPASSYCIGELENWRHSIP